MWLKRTGEIALITATGEITYRRLSLLADAFARALARALPRTRPRSRRALVALLGDRETGTVAAYLAALREGHAVAWLGRDDLVDRYRPEVIVSPGALPGGTRIADVWVAPGPGSPLEIHEDTSLLLLTSGTVSGGRGVRLSAAALRYNADAIRQSLGIDESSRGVTALPLIYTYGLSVLNSHLSAGAAVLLTDLPATGRRFWRLFCAADCDGFPGVPAHYEWLARARVPWRRIRTMTVSGAPIATPLAAEIHARLDAHGGRFLKMYGQTETTARITVLQHEDFPRHPDSVGRPVPGCRLTIEDGRVVYHGPGAMQGYADDRAGLALPDQMNGVVDTGDLGRLHDGRLYLSGRSGRFVKPGGRRVALDALEEHFSQLVPAAAVGTPDEHAHVFVEAAARREGLSRLRSELLDRLGLAPAALRLHFVDRLPRRTNGKIDYGSLRDQAADL